MSQRSGLSNVRHGLQQTPLTTQCLPLTSPEPAVDSWHADSIPLQAPASLCFSARVLPPVPRSAQVQSSPQGQVVPQGQPTTNKVRELGRNVPLFRLSLGQVGDTFCRPLEILQWD